METRGLQGPPAAFANTHFIIDYQDLALIDCHDSIPHQPITSAGVGMGVAFAWDNTTGKVMVKVVPLPTWLWTLI